MTTPQATPDDMSLRSVLDSTLKDFGVSSAPQPAAPAATEPTPQVNITKLPIDRRTQALIALGALLLIGIGSYAWGMFREAPAAPTAAPTLAALASTVAPTAAPATPVAALVGYFDYQDTSTTAAIDASQIRRVIGQAGSSWRLVDVGNARVWLPADQVPAGVPVDSPLPDLTPRRPAPPAPQPAYAPVSAPAAAPAPCSADTAPYRVERQVLNGTLPIGAAMGFSCTSAAEAEANAAEHEAEVRANYQATVTAKTSEAKP